MDDLIKNMDSSQLLMKLSRALSQGTILIQSQLNFHSDP